jgi:hypothetical protein
LLSNLALPLADGAPFRPIRLSNVIRTMRGGSQSKLVSCDDGRHYVSKMRPNPQGPNILANEALGAMLLHELGLPCPRFISTLVCSATIRKFPKLAFGSKRELRAPQEGLHFASRFLDVAGSLLFDFLPESYRVRIENTADLLGIFIFDVWASHQARRQCVYRQDLRTGKIFVVFIDNGHLFGGPDWSKLDKYDYCRTVCPNDSRELSREEARTSAWISQFQKTIPPLLHQTLGLLPPAWFEGDIDLLSTRLLERLQILPDLIELQRFGIPNATHHSAIEPNDQHLRICNNRPLPERDRDRGNRTFGML